MPFAHSKILTSRVPDILRRVPARLFAAKAGIDVETAKRLKSDPHIIPPVPLIAGLCHAYGLVPSDIVTLDPAAETASRPRRIVVCAMGNQGHAWAAWLASRPDAEVACLVSSAARAEALAPSGRTEITLRRADGTSTGGAVTVTADTAAAVGAADLVVITAPADCHLETLNRVVPHLRLGACVTCAPGWAGFDWKARRVLDRAGRADVAVFAIASVPWMAKVSRPGAEVFVPGAKIMNSLVPVLGLDTGSAADLASVLLGVPVIPFPSSLDIHLMPGNQILHTGIMMDLFGAWDGRPLAQAPLFYEGLGEAAADLVAAMNRDLIVIGQSLKDVGPGFAPNPLLDLHLALRAGYPGDIKNASTLRSSIATNAAYAGVRAPMVPVPGGLAPDFTHRFFTEDVPHGLALAIGCARLAGAATPALDRVIAWCQGRMGKVYVNADGTFGPDWGETSAPQNFGIASAADLVARSLPKSV